MNNKESSEYLEEATYSKMDCGLKAIQI